MTHPSPTRRASAIVVAVALGIATPAAGAKPIDSGPAGSFIAASPTYALANTQSAVSHAGGGRISDSEVVLAGSGGASVALVGVGAALATSRRRRRRRTAGAPTVAA